MSRPRLNYFIPYSVIVADDHKSLRPGDVVSIIENDMAEISGLRVIVQKNHPRKKGVTARKA